MDKAELEHRRNSKCPECGTRGYLILPGFGKCQTCLKLRLDRIDSWDKKNEQATGEG